MAERLPGKFSITHPHSSKEMPEEHEVRIILEDSTSHIHFLEIRCSKRQLMEALFGEHNKACTFTLHRIEHVGMRRENKEIKMLIPQKQWENESTWRQLVRQTLAINETDGWQADAYEEQHIDNHHRIIGHEDEGFWRMVPYYRYVPASQE